MLQRSLMMVVAFCLTLCLLTSPAWAILDQQDLEGTWNTEVWGGSPSGNQCWDQCTLTIGADGTIQAAGTYTDCFGVNSEITGGQLTVYPGFRIEGTIVTSSATIHVGAGGIIGDKLVLGTDQ